MNYPALYNLIMAPVSMEVLPANTKLDINIDNKLECQNSNKFLAVDNEMAQLCINRLDVSSPPDPGDQPGGR